MRRGPALPAVACIALALSGCGSGTEPVECHSSAQCNLSAGGFCDVAPSGHQWCRYDDAACPSGSRWSSSAGDGLAGMCIAPLDAGVQFPLTASKTGTGTGSISSTPTGLSCGTTCQAMFPSGSTVTLTAVNDSQAVFVGWGGDASSCGYQAQCTVTMNAAKTVSAAFSPTGTVLWVKQAGGASSGTQGTAVAFDSSGYVYVAGYFSANAMLGTQPLTNQGGVDAFVAKLSGSDGSVVWTRQIGSAGADFAYGLAVDPASHDVIVVGSFGGSVDFGSGTPTSATASATNGFAARYAAANGAYVWVRPFTITQNQWRNTPRPMVSGTKVLVTGGYFGSVNFGTGAKNSAGNEDMFVATLALADGSVSNVWTYGGANSVIQPYDDSVDTSGNLVIGGRLQGSVSITGITNALQSAGAGGDALLLKLDGASGNGQWARVIGTADVEDSIGAVVIGSLGTTSNNVFAFGGVQQVGADFGAGPVSSKGTFIAQYNTLGEYGWAKVFPSGGGFTGAGLSQGRILGGGQFFGSVTLDTMTITARGNYDAFGASLDDTNGAAKWLQRFGGTDLTSINSVAVDPSTGRIFYAGYFRGLAQYGPFDLTSIGASPATDGVFFAVAPSN